MLKDGAVVMTGRIASDASASGRITSGACAREGLLGDSDKWVAKKA